MGNARRVDSTGAGDFYAAGFLFGLCRGLSMEQCGTIGSIAAGKVIEVVGTTFDEKVWEEIRRMVGDVKPETTSCNARIVQSVKHTAWNGCLIWDTSACSPARSSPRQSFRSDSDVLLLGMLAAGEEIWLCVLVATLGNWLGGLTSYWLGWLGKWEWIERYMGVKHEKPRQTQKQNRPLRLAAGPVDLVAGRRRRIRDRSRILQGGFQESGRPDADRQRSPLRLLGPLLFIWGKQYF